MRLFTKDTNIDKLQKELTGLEFALNDKISPDISSFRKLFPRSLIASDEVENEAIAANHFFNKFFSEIVPMEEHELRALVKAFTELRSMSSEIKDVYNRIAKNIHTLKELGETAMVEDGFFQNKHREDLFNKAIINLSKDLPEIQSYEDALNEIFNDLSKKDKQLSKEVKKTVEGGKENILDKK